jgi:hypothetical protein
MDKVQKVSDSKCYRSWPENPSGCNKKTDGEAPTELPIAQHKNNLSSVLTEMSAGCPGGLEASTADQYSQDPRFKTDPLH